MPNPTPKRQRQLTFLTPSIEDILISTTEDTSRIPIPEFGTPHPDTERYPDHKFTFAKPTDDAAGAQGLAYTFYYAAEREDQDEYNFEFQDADLGAVKFKTITRTYVTPRANFDPVSPKMGDVMPDRGDEATIPLDPPDVFPDSYILAYREQKRIEDRVLDPLFIVDQQVFISRTSIAKVELDIQTGNSKRSVTNLYYRGEEVNGVTIEDLAEDIGNSYWTLQGDGTFHELEQLSYNWFAVTDSVLNGLGSDGGVLGPGNPAKTRVQTRVTPLGTDILFYEVGAMPDPAPAYGTPHYDTTNWPDHELVFIAPADEVGILYRFYYAATRPTQDLYNFEDQNGEQLLRTYFMKREEYLDADYFAEQFANVALPLDGDDRFPMYVFADESVDHTVQELDSLYVIVRRRFIEKVRTRQFYDDRIHCDVEESVTVIKAKTGSSSSSAGSVTEIQPINIWHDLESTKTVLGFSSQKQLPTLIKDVPFNFPRLLKGAEWTGVAALANSTQAPISYDESWYIHYDLVEPTEGPYEARVLRFLTGDPNSLRAAYPIQKIVTRIETIGIARAYAFGSDKGNTTFADAKQLEVPSSIHDTIEIGGFDTIGRAQNQSTGTLFKTPNYDTFVALNEMVAGYEPEQVDYGLYIISIIIINLTGLYNGKTVPFQSGGVPGGTGAGDVSNSVDPPSISEAYILADNSKILGKASPTSQVSASVDSIEIATAQADTLGNFTLILPTPVYKDDVIISVVARRSNVRSPIRNIHTYDLAPLAPSATISANLTTLTGKTEPGATLSILVNGANQKETATVIDKYAQEITLVCTGPVTTDGNANVDFTSVVTGGPISVVVPLLTTDTDSQIAVKVREALMLTTSISTHWTFFVNGNSVVGRAVVTTANDVTALTALTNGGTGITDTNSTITVAGNTAMSITTAGTADLIVTSNLIAGSPITVSFALEVGDAATDVAAKAEIALEASVVDDGYTPTSSTNTFSIEARVIAPNDPSLNIAIANGTCVGLVESAQSVEVQAGGSPFTVIANGSGNYSYAFGTALTSGDTVTVVASDDGGTSPPTLVTASLTPPTLNSTPAFPPGDYDSITGTASVASVVKAYVNDVLLGSAVTSGGGSYNITLSESLVSGELVRVVATDAGTPSIQSASRYINASDLNLAQPLYDYSDLFDFYGTAPVGATDIIVRYPDNSEHPATFYDAPGESRNFNFTLPGQNGEEYAIFARYPQGDSDPLYERAPVVNLAPPAVTIFDRFRNTVLDTVTEAPASRYRAPDTSRDGFLVHIEPAPGTTLAQTLITFPGQATASFVPASSNQFAYAVGAPKPGGVGVSDATWRGPMMYLNNAPPGTTNAQLRAIFTAQLPVLMEVLCTATDGRQSKLTWSRADYLEQFSGVDSYYG